MGRVDERHRRDRQLGLKGVYNVQREKRAGEVSIVLGSETIKSAAFHFAARGETPLGKDVAFVSGKRKMG